MGYIVIGFFQVHEYQILKNIKNYIGIPLLIKYIRKCEVSEQLTHVIYV